MAAERRTETDIADLRSLLTEMDDAEAVDPSHFIVADVGFHMQIAKAARNPPLASVLESIGVLLKAWMSGVASSSPEHDPTREHVAIMEAIEDGDGQRARAAMQSHLSAAYGRLRSVHGIGPARSLVPQAVPNSGTSPTEPVNTTQFRVR